jgi:hypothetical protein
MDGTQALELAVFVVAPVPFLRCRMRAARRSRRAQGSRPSGSGSFASGAGGACGGGGGDAAAGAIGRSIGLPAARHADVPASGTVDRSGLRVRPQRPGRTARIIPTNPPLNLPVAAAQ